MKAIMYIEIPKSCEECKFCIRKKIGKAGLESVSCLFTNLQIGAKEITKPAPAPFCPLKNVEKE